VAVGPDLAALTDRSPDALLTAIFDPGREVDARYVVYAASLRDGRTLSGIIAAETANAITFVRQDGQPSVVLRSEIEELASSGKSLMPEGLEKDLPKSDVAHLLAFLTVDAERPKTLPGNRPRAVTAGADGVIRLDAASAEVYGPTLTFETEYSNLGWWQGAGDRATWSFRVDRPGVFTVSIEAACPDESAGNAYEVRLGQTRFRHVVGSTGAWSRYRGVFVGEADLAAGPHRLEVRPAGPIRNALFDLRAVVLSPRAGAAPR
jgi:putative heme-binding domain-containing protein